ncbi:MAG: YfhO family protein, partial [Planctomycetes bacterium]|nr:YfhO family protein [Planctomycetota bacterium]
QKWLGLLAFLVSALAALGLVELMRTPARRWVWAIGAAAVIDVFLCGSPFLKERLVEAEAFRPEIPTRPEKRVDGYSPHDRLLRLPTSGAFAGLRMGGRQAPASEAELRAEMRRSAIAWNIETLLGNNASRAGARRVSGISSFSFRRMEILWAEAARRGEVARLADILAARWILTSPADAEEFRSREHLRGLLPPDPPAAAWRTPRGDLEIYRRPTALPRAFFVREGFAVDGDRAAIDALLDPRNDPRRCVILEAQNEMRQGARAGKPSPGGRGSGRSGDADADPPQVAFIEDREEVIVLDVSGVEPGGGYLVLADSYDAGWEAEVDGRPVEIHRANCFARAVAVPPGECRVVMRYRPLSLRLGALTSAAALLLILPALLRRPRRRA